MENYSATFELEVLEQYENEEQCGGQIVFRSLNNPDIVIATSQVSYEHFRQGIYYILTVLHEGNGEASISSDFSNGGYFINLNNNIMKFSSEHHGTANSFTVIVNNSLIEAFEKIQRFMN